MKIHEVKTWPKPYAALNAGLKTADFRRNDRGYEDGDLLIQREYSPSVEDYTGRVLAHKITHIQDGFGIPKGFVMLSLENI